MSVRRSLLSALLVPMLAGALATASAGTGHAASPLAAAHRVQVSIVNFAFSPAKLKIKAGTTVVWTNKDSVAHTVTGKGGHWGSGDLNQGQSYAYTFKKAGTYTYYCAVHPSMTAQIIVTAAARGKSK